MDAAVEAEATAAVEVEDRLIEVEDGVRLAVRSWKPLQSTSESPVLFVAGWVSLLSGWQPLLDVLVRSRPVYYLETREKQSAVIPGRLLRSESFTIPRLADDIVEVADALELNDGSAVLFGSSMGSNAVLEALKRGRLRARAAFLVGPNAGFRFPWWGRIAVRIVPAWLVERLKGFVIWYLRRFRVDSSSDPQQMARYVRTVRAADALRLKLSSVAVLDYSALPGLDTIGVPVAVAYAPSDSLHNEREIRLIVDAMPLGTALACPSNTYMHTAAVASDLDRYLAGLDGNGG